MENKRADIEKYIRLQHRKDHKWLQDHIEKKFGVVMPLNTIRGWKRKLGCYTNGAAIRKDWTEYIRKNWRTQTDKELQEQITNKFGRKISWTTVKSIRLKHHWCRSSIVGKGHYTVKEIRDCLNCGKKIKITCKNPEQKFCCHGCSATYQRRTNYKKHLANTTPVEIKNFMMEWTPFFNKVLYDNKFELTSLDLEEIKADYYGIVPSIVSGIKIRNLTRKQHIKGYIAKAIRHLIFKRLRTKIDMKRNEVNLDDYDGNQRYYLEFKAH